MIFKPVLIIYVAIVLIATSCSWSKQEKLTLKRSSFEGVDEIDTIEAFPERGIYIVQLIRYGFLGRFTLRLAFEKKTLHPLTEKLIYEVDTRLPYNVSKDYISLIDEKMGVPSWGWFWVKHGKIQESLPKMDKIHDSIGKANPAYFVQEGYGYFTIYNNGNEVRTLNYGNFITKHQQLNFDNLNYSLYKLDGDSLIVTSKNGNDLMNQQDGVYFVPKPGYGVKNMYSKEVILNLIDSVSKISLPISTLKIEPVKPF